MLSKMKKETLDIKEEKINRLAYIFSNLAAIEAFIMVVIFLDGTIKDAVILLMPVFGILQQILEKKCKWFQPYVKYIYQTLPFWCSIILIVDGEGRFSAVTQLYFMWLCLTVAYCSVKMVLLCSFITISCTALSVCLFPEAMLKLHNLTSWVYILTIYIMAAILAAIVAGRMRNLLEEARKVKKYENELVYLEQLEKKEEKHSEWIHNMNHYMIAIGELAKEKHCEQIVSLMEELNENLLQNERMIYTRHKMINAMLSEKTNEAKNLNLDFDVYVEPGIKATKVNDGDWVAMLGNLLDNAFEAGMQCQDEKRKIVFRMFMEKDGKVCVVRIQNYFVNPPKRHKSGFLTNKKEKELHGIGIKSVENIAKKYNGYLQCKIEEDSFLAVLILPVNVSDVA